MPAQAMVLAAGRGERMRPLTDTCPKPLLEVRGRPLIGWHLDSLAAAGYAETVINTAWLGEQVEVRCGARHGGMRLAYSHEGRDFGGALETAGGIARALPLLDEVFWIMAGDVYVPGFVFEMFPVLRAMLSRRGGDLSGGQQQQLAIARALAMQPKVLILDEPTEGIQPSIIKEIGRAIEALAAGGDMAILLVEQYYDFAKALADRYVVMSRGAVVAKGEAAAMDADGVKGLLTV